MLITNWPLRWRVLLVCSSMIYSFLLDFFSLFLVLQAATDRSFYVPYNILPLDPGGAQQAIMQLPEVWCHEKVLPLETLYIYVDIFQWVVSRTFEKSYLHYLISLKDMLLFRYHFASALVHWGLVLYTKVANAKCMRYPI